MYLGGIGRKGQNAEGKEHYPTPEDQNERETAQGGVATD